MVAFAETQQCRMTALIRHFGDTADAHRPCGACDFCAPGSTTAQSFVTPTPTQTRDLLAILSALVKAPSRATGKLHTDLAPNLHSATDRKAFDILLDALARAGLITLTSETFTNAEGRTLPYKKAALTHEGRSEDATNLTGVVLPTASDFDTARTRTRGKRAAASPPRKSSPGFASQSTLKPVAAGGVAPEVSPVARKSLARTVPTTPDPVPLTPAQQQLDEALRAWRKSESEKMGLPQFFVLASSTLRSIVLERPQNLSQLQLIAGIGPDKAERFGSSILALCNP